MRGLHWAPKTVGSAVIWMVSLPGENAC